MAERLYRGLHPVGMATEFESVHLASWPASRPESRSRELEESMAAVLQVVSLGRSLRSAHELKVRQPLREGMVFGRSPVLKRTVESSEYAELIEDELNLKRIAWLDDPTRVAKVTAKANFRELGARFGKKTPLIAKRVAALDAEALGLLRNQQSLELEVEGEKIELRPQEVFIQEEGLKGYVTASERDCMLALNIELDGTLRREGLARELVNRIQNLRKEAGLAVSDRISLYVGGEGEVESAFSDHRRHVCEETLASELADSVPEGAASETFEIDGHSAVIALIRAEG
jgi:isoleucyl-tRNA synthetase